MPVPAPPAVGGHVPPERTRSRQALVGRQPIYDLRNRVFGYELLYRGDPTDDQAATAQVMLNTFLELGVANVTGGRTAFVNMSRECLLSDYARALPAESVVLEILEGVRVDRELRQALEELSAAGYRLALDDFIDHDERMPLVEIAPLVKVEIPAIAPDRLAGLAAELIDRGATLLAEKVETREESDRCRELGFQYFQGFYLSRPTIVQGKRLPANRLGILALVAKLRDPEVSLRVVERFVSQDATLTFKLLQFANSALVASRRRIDSIGVAIRMAGIYQVTAWATVLLMARLDDKPGEVLAIALVRAHFCEELVRAVRPADLHGALLTGMLSMVDVMTDRPLEEVMAQLPVTDEVATAVLAREGLLGEALAAAVAHERGDWDAVAFEGLTPGQITEAYLGAVSKAREYEALVGAAARDGAA